jgi:hypothetical protein
MHGVKHMGEAAEVLAVSVPVMFRGSTKKLLLFQLRLDHRNCLMTFGSYSARPSHQPAAR